MEKNENNFFMAPSDYYKGLIILLFIGILLYLAPRYHGVDLIVFCSVCLVSLVTAIFFVACDLRSIFDSLFDENSQMEVGSLREDLNFFLATTAVTAVIGLVVGYLIN